MSSSKENAPGIRGMDDPAHVKDFFLTKGHTHLVFRTADILDLGEEDQELFLGLIVCAGDNLFPDGWPNLPLRSKIQGVGHRGYATISIARMCSTLSIDDLQAVQALCQAYHDVRQGKLEPSVWEECDDCRGKKKGCPHCGGSGKVRVLVEMSEIEAALAEGKSWNQIDEGLLA